MGRPGSLLPIFQTGVRDSHPSLSLANIHADVCTPSNNATPLPIQINLKKGGRSLPIVDLGGEGDLDDDGVGERNDDDAHHCWMVLMMSDGVDVINDPCSQVVMVAMIRMP